MLGRILFDAAYVNANHQDDKLNSGVAVPDMRVGVGFSYERWKGKIDIGYAYGKVNMKDVWLQYNFDEKNFVRGGYFIHQYGYQSCTSSSFKETMEEPQSNAVFNNDRIVGLMFEHMDEKVLATASVVVESDAMKQTTDQTGNQALGAMTRLVYHPTIERGKIFHVGISGGIEGARYSSDHELNHKHFTLSTRWPIRDAEYGLDCIIREFSLPFGLQISKEDPPEIYKLLREATATCDSICTAPKKYYMRRRPFMRMHEQTLYPADEPALRKNGSFPSSHTILGWSSALLLMEINPDRADTLLARGYMYGESRVIVGAHWQSDVDTGRLAASVAYARLHTSDRFLEQMRLARLEFRVKKGLATAAEKKEYLNTEKKRAKTGK